MGAPLRRWESDEIEWLLRARKAGNDYAWIARKLGRTIQACKLQHMRQTRRRAASAARNAKS